MAGNPGHRSIDDAPEFARVMPRCPDWLNEDGRREWKRVTRELFDAGILTTVDRAALAAFCQAYGRWVDAERKVTEKGAVLKTSQGNLIQNPYLSIANRALEQMLKTAAEFGMTPSSRSRIKAGAPQAEPTLADLLFGDDVEVADRDVDALAAEVEDTADA
jgi:P27 family predicted phage terminase small subunit